MPFPLNVPTLNSKLSTSSRMSGWGRLKRSGCQERVPAGRKVRLGWGEQALQLAVEVLGGSARHAGARRVGARRARRGHAPPTAPTGADRPTTTSHTQLGCVGAVCVCVCVCVRARGSSTLTRAGDGTRRPPARPTIGLRPHTVHGVHTPACVCVSGGRGGRAPRVTASSPQNASRLAPKHVARNTHR